MPFPNTTATTGQVVTAAFWNDEIKDNFDTAFPDGVNVAAWSPGLAGTGSGASVTVVGRQYQVGALQFLWAKFTIVGAGGGDGFYFVTLPTPAVGVTVSSAEGSGQSIGTWTIRDDSGPNSRNGSVLLRAADQVWFNLGPGMVSADNPFSMTTDDSLSFDAVYPIA